MRRTAAVATAVVVAVALAVGLAWWVVTHDEPAPPSAAEGVGPTASPSASPPSSPPPSPSTSPSPDPACDDVSRAFAPKAITVPGVARGVAVLAPPRDANGVPGVPPLSGDGKAVFAWDREQGIRPGDTKGNVLLNAHTWPDGSALGNRLLADLQVGDRMVVHGGRSRLCYRVTERVEVPADQRMLRYYKKDGPPQLAIVVCSGRRLGPGQWEKRTVWFASPAA
ncbi:MAG: class F sortase [Nocardioidaceae bacterium]